MRDSPIYSTSYTDLSGYVPYTGATANLELGSNNLTTTAHVQLIADNARVEWGAGADANIKYDGTDLLIASDAVGTGNAKFTNNIALADSKKVLLGTADDGTLYYDGTDLVIDAAEVGSGAVKINSAFAFADVVILAQGSTTPDVSGGNLFTMDAGRFGTTITNFTFGKQGQIIIFRPTNDDVIIANGTPIQLNGSANFAMTENDTITLVKFSARWFEISRMEV